MTISRRTLKVSTRSRKIKKPPEHQAVYHGGDWHSELSFRASSVLSAQGTVASPCPVAGFSLQAEPLLMLTCIVGKSHPLVKDFVSRLSSFFLRPPSEQQVGL